MVTASSNMLSFVSVCLPLCSVGSLSCTPSSTAKSLRLKCLSIRFSKVVLTSFLVMALGLHKNTGYDRLLRHFNACAYSISHGMGRNGCARLVEG